MSDFLGVISKFGGGRWSSSEWKVVLLNKSSKPCGANIRARPIRNVVFHPPTKPSPLASFDHFHHVVRMHVLPHHRFFLGTSASGVFFLEMHGLHWFAQETCYDSRGSDARILRGCFTFPRSSGKDRFSRRNPPNVCTSGSCDIIFVLV